jgi:hypothetical protein
MVDARLNGLWLNTIKYDALTDVEWRVFTGGLMWAAENMTDGHVPSRYLRMLHPDGEKPEAIDGITKHGLWEAVDGGYQFIDWAGELHQSTAESIDKQRADNRARAAASRARAQARAAGTTAKPAPAFPSTVTRDVTRDVTGDVPPHVGIGKGKGKGKGIGYAPGVSNDETVNENTGEVKEFWPVAQIGTGAADNCRVCGDRLYSDESKAIGLCRKGTEDHSAARAAAS